MKWIVLGVLVSAFFLAFLLLPAGRLDWPAAYASVTLLVSGWVMAARRLQSSNPILFARRAEHGEGTPNWDRWLVFVLKGSVLGVFVLAGLDSGRVARLPELTLGVLGLILYLAGLKLFMASQQANPFFEGMVRHQSEFGHCVVEQGPYARIRHPGYLGFLLVFASVPCLLGSLWAAWGLLPVLACFITRIVLEERFLCEHLPGYSEYRQRVRYRLIPGLW
jgi:protein-S-isoprenylcysteine O-methyltransferase Ste14